MNCIKRQSSFELLRIISMFMIMSLHTFNDKTNSSLINYYYESLCMPAVDVFVLISGYFSIRWKIRSIMSLLFHVYFYVIVLFSFFLFLGIVPFTSQLLFRCFNGIHLYWFVASYVSLYLLSPILNVFVENVNSKSLGFLLLLLFVWQTYLFFPHSNVELGIGYTTLLFCNLYLLGAFLKKIDIPLLKVPIVLLIISYFFFAFLLASFTYGFNSIHYYNICVVGSLYGFSHFNPVVIIEAILLFVIFSKISFFNRIVNLFALSTLSVYLLHMHPCVKGFFYEITSSFVDDLFIIRFVKLIILCFLFFLVSLLLDMLRRPFFNLIYTDLFVNLIWNTKK